MNVKPPQAGSGVNYGACLRADSISRWISPWRFSEAGFVQLFPVSQMSFCTLMFSLSVSACGVSTHRTSTLTVFVHCIFLWITFQTAVAKIPHRFIFYSSYLMLVFLRASLRGLQLLHAGHCASSLSSRSLLTFLSPVRLFMLRPPSQFLLEQRSSKPNLLLFLSPFHSPANESPPSDLPLSFPASLTFSAFAQYLAGISQKLSVHLFLNKGNKQADWRTYFPSVSRWNVMKEEWSLSNSRAGGAEIGLRSESSKGQRQDCGASSNSNCATH